jgi:hypothetical protein
MELRYDEDFVEAAAFLCTSGRRKGVSTLQIARFHRERERLYSILDPDDRNTAFFRLHLEWFREWGLEEVLTGLVKEFPLLTRMLSVLVVRKTRGKNDDGAELYVNEARQRSAIVALPPDFFERDVTLRNYLRHEFTHLSDMLRPDFGYLPTLDLPGLNSAQQRLARERYRLIWDITIDGRLSAAGHVPMATCEQHRAAFFRGYSFWPEARRTDTFDALWQNGSPAHAQFLALIADPRGLRESHGPAPGASCPLCGFPTFAWVSDGAVTTEIARTIAAQFPDWTTEQSLCTRCLETYETLAGVVVH